MTIREISNLPTIYNDKDNGRSHESLLRAFHIVEKVKLLITRGCDIATIGELIAEMENGDARN